MSKRLRFGLIDSEELCELIRDTIRHELNEFTTKHSQKQNRETLLTRSETASLIRISLPTLSKLVKTGKLPAYWVGGKMLFNKADVLSRLEEVQTKRFNND